MLGQPDIDANALDTIVLVADSPLPMPSMPPTIEIVRPDSGATIPTPRYRLQAELDDLRYAEVTFAVAIDGADPTVVGVDDAPPYRLYWDNSALPEGSSVDIIATVNDGVYLRSDVVNVTLGDRS